MIYEIRTYWAAPGKIDALHSRFRSLTLEMFRRHNMELVGFWTPSPATEATGDLVYIMRFPDEAAKIAGWKAFQSDPDWIIGKAATEAEGTLVTRLTSVLLDPTDYSPIK